MKLKFTSINGFALSVFFLTALFAFVSVNSYAQEAGVKPNQKLARQAKITKAQAREIAAKRAAGKIEGEELEREHGKLVYSFDIRNARGTITEVQVDAKTGKIVSTEEETKAQEMKEKSEDQRKAKKSKAKKG